MLNILLLGPPGSGKGTVAQMLTEKYQFSLLSTGNMLRQAIQEETALGLEAKKIMDKGQLVSDQIMLDMVVDNMKNYNNIKGWVFDGFPRTIVQAEAMIERGIKLDLVLFLSASDEVIIRRMSGRRVHTASGRVYHIDNNPPKVEGKDDITGESLAIRSDDQEDVVRKRLAVYRELTEPLIDFYEKMSIINYIEYRKLDADNSVDFVLNEVNLILSVI